MRSGRETLIPWQVQARIDPGSLKLHLDPFPDINACLRQRALGRVQTLAQSRRKPRGPVRIRLHCKCVKQDQMAQHLSVHTRKQLRPAYLPREFEIEPHGPPRWLHDHVDEPMIDIDHVTQILGEETAAANGLHNGPWRIGKLVLARLPSSA